VWAGGLFLLLLLLRISAPVPAAEPIAGAGTNQVYPIDLPTTLQLASAQNLDIQIARQKLAEAKANHESAVAQFFPWLSPGVAYRRHDNRIQDVAGNMLDADKQAYAVGGALTAQLDLGDALYKSLVAKQLVTVAGLALESQRQDSSLAAVQAYYDLAKAKALVEVVQEALSISSDYQRQLHQAVDLGIAFKGDELRVQTQTERYELALRQAREQQRVAAARLAQALHLDPSVDLAPADADLVPLTLVGTNVPLDSLMQQALQWRPELKQSQGLVTAARDARKGAVYGPLIPSLGAQAFGGGLGGGKNGSLGNFGDSEDYLVGLGWRIGPGGLFDASRLHASNARLEAARLTRAKVQDEIARQVVESHVRAQSLQDQIATTKQNLATAAETLRLTRQRKQFGVGAVLEDIQAQQELARARSDHLSAVAELNKAQFALTKAIGGLRASGLPEGVARPQ